MSAARKAKAEQEFDCGALARRLAELADSKGAAEIVVLDMRELVSYTDYLAICTARNANHLGASLEVLVDSKAKGRWGGRSRGNQLVHFEDDRDLLGQLVDVNITKSSPWYLMGEAIGAPR